MEPKGEDRRAVTVVTWEVPGGTLRLETAAPFTRSCTVSVPAERFSTDTTTLPVGAAAGSPEPSEPEDPGKGGGTR